MILSILICSIQSRAELLTRLLDYLKSQIELCEAWGKVEILTNVDNKQKSTGKKRQELIEQARGKYVIFIDDDDWVMEYYVEELLAAAESDADCFAINGWITTDGRGKMEWRLSKDNPNVTVKEAGVHVYLRTTNHITAVKRGIALQAGFPDKSNAEDKAYSDALKPLLRTEHKINKPMYHYRYVTTNKEYI